MIRFSKPDEFPTSGYFIVYEKSNTSKQLSIFKVWDDMVKCVNDITSINDGNIITITRIPAIDAVMIGYSRNSYIKKFYNCNAIHFTLTDEEILLHIVANNI